MPGIRAAGLLHAGEVALSARVYSPGLKREGLQGTSNQCRLTDLAASSAAYLDVTGFAFFGEKLFHVLDRDACILLVTFRLPWHHGMVASWHTRAQGSTQGIAR